MWSLVLGTPAAVMSVCQPFRWARREGSPLLFRVYLLHKLWLTIPEGSACVGTAHAGSVLLDASKYHKAS